MAGKLPSSQEKKFVSLLASRFKNEHYSFEGEELDSLFGDAVSNLPDGELKTGIKRHYQAHLNKLKSLLVVKKSQELPVTTKRWTFNLFKENGIDIAINKAKTSQSSKERNDMCTKVWCCYPSLKDSKLFSALEELNDNKDLAFIEDTLCHTVGCINQKSVLQCLEFLLREFSRMCDSCIKDDNQRSTCKELQEALQRYIVLINYRWMSCSNTSNIYGKEASESYEDLMAALLSLYTDLVLVTESDDTSDSVVDKLASLIFVALGHSPVHCMDIMLQVSQPVASLIPLLRYILERNKGPLNHRQYIKFICLSRLALKVSSTGSTETALSIHKVVENQGAPLGFVSFLLQTNKSLVECLRITKKMPPTLITSHLLGDIDEEHIEALLDISTDCLEQQIDFELQDTDVPQADHPTESLFFIDSSGGQENTDENEVEYEENTGTETLLRKQMKSLIGELHKDSDSESEEEDVLDDVTHPVDETLDSEKESKTQKIEQEIKINKKRSNDTLEQPTKKSKSKDLGTPMKALRRSSRNK